MPSPQPDDAPAPTRVGVAGIAAMLAIVLTFGAVAVFSRVQRSHRDRIEKVTISTLSPSPTDSPAAP